MANLEARRAEAVALVGEERERAWRLYMLASAIGFDDGEITVYQVLAANGSPHALPLNRADLLGARERSGASARTATAGGGALMTGPTPTSEVIHDPHRAQRLLMLEFGSRAEFEDPSLE